jgi:hypothetical protein
MNTVALVRVSDQTPPEDDDVTAGTWGALMFALLVVATVILMRSFLKQMRKTDEAKKAGVFGDEPEPEEPREGDEPSDRS